MSEIDELQEQRKAAWKILKSSHVLKVRAEKLFNALEDRYQQDKKKYELIDHQLALIDGRVQKILAATITATKKNKPTVDLTEDQIMQIARQLGIVLPEAEEETEE